MIAYRAVLDVPRELVLELATCCGPSAGPVAPVSGRAC